MKDYRPIWKKLAASKFFDGKDVEQYCLLKAMSAKNPNKIGLTVALLQSAFSPIKNPQKLNNGCQPYSALYSLFGKKWSSAPRPLNQCLETSEEKKEYTRIREEALVTLGKELNEYHCFTIVRQDISSEQQMIQFGHAVGIMLHDLGYNTALAGASLEHESPYPNDIIPHELNFVVCGVKNKEEVEGAAEYIYSYGYNIHKFYESDLNNELTAVASGPIPSPKRHFMRKYKLLTFK